MYACPSLLKKLPCNLLLLSAVASVPPAGSSTPVGLESLGELKLVCVDLDSLSEFCPGSEDTLRADVRGPESSAGSVADRAL